MLRYGLSRVRNAVPTLLIIVTIAFFMVRLAPGGPFDAERSLPPEIEKNLAAAYHLDEPLPAQYVRYLSNIVRGDFGPSFRYRDHTVSELIAIGFPVSLKLGIAAIVLALVFGTLLGSLAALRQNSSVDYGVMGTAMLGIAIPGFVVAPLLSLVFGVHLGWLPAGGWEGGAVRNMVLPVTALALPQIAVIARLTRGSMIEILHSDFIRTAHAKGLPARLVVFRHALPGALMPVVSYLGPAVAGIVTGSVVIEQIFGLPGIGRFFIQGALNRDYTLVTGVVIFYGSLLITANLIVDLVYGWLDPRVRYE
ncbi:MAG TPA: oligopeptide ABC transporter permease OppB [Sneathiellales bacterium]|nr:oligopeptide ABC transporter permease OppB [Sneathiellales bacterium]